MPLGMRIVEPYRLGRKPLRPEERDEGPNAERAVIHNAVLGAMLQLASLIRHADDIFCDLAEECQKICEKSEKISRKVAHIEDLTRQLDSKKVQIPVGDLKKFSSVGDHHAAYHGFDCHMFTAESRPQCVKDQYILSDVTPAKILRGADAYRKDGLYSSLLFKLWPVFHNEPKLKTQDLNLPKRMQPVLSFKKDYKKLKLRERPKTVALDDLHIDENATAEEEQLTPNKKPSTVVIDTSGSAFNRMCSFRESLKSDSSGKSKRRRTVSGVSDNILQEIKVFEKEKRIGGRIQPRSYSFDDLDAEDDPKKDEIMAQYFNEIDAKYEEYMEDDNAAKEPRYMKFIPCRRTRSLPRSIKSRQRCLSTEHRMSTTSHSYASSTNLSQSVVSIASSRFSRATRRSSIIGNKIKTMVQNVSSSVSRSRPKSLDLDALDFNAESEPSPARAKSTMHLPNANSMPDGIMSGTSGSESSVGPGSYYYFESNTLPKAQAQKYDFPWESLPKDWTTAVKLREISKRRPKEERQSSSGHWSASSCSNRQSMESGKSSMPSSYSAISLGKDSGRDSPSLSEDRHGTDTTTYKESSVTADTDSDCRDQFTKMDTDAWLKSLAIRAASREEISSSSADTLSSLSRLTRQNILALDLMSPDLNNQPKLEDEFSEFSVDQDGFYTSFHNDSGLRRSNANLAEEDGELSPTKEHSTIFSMGSTTTIDSVIFRPTSGPGASIGKGKGTVLKRVSVKLPPPPPQRTCSMTSISVPISNTTFEIGEPSPNVSDGSSASLNVTDKSFSESDQETIYARLKSKTHISTSLAYPSWCSVSPSDSGEEIRLSPNSAGNISKTADDELKEKEESQQNSKENHSGNTLPRTRKYLSKKKWDEEEVPDYPNSWPRSQKSGILKTDKSPVDASKPSKTLNFDPVVNMVDPLPDLSGSSEESWSSSQVNSPTDGKNPSYRLAIPFIDDSADVSKETIPIKYQPTITVTPKGRPGDGTKSSICDVGSKNYVRSTSTPTNHYAVGNLKGVRITAPSEISSSSLSMDRGGYMDMSSNLKNRSMDNLSSCSSLNLSDIDDSITYVSMSSPFSTPNNSTLTLNRDAKFSESASKQHAPKMDTYRVSSALLEAAGKTAKGTDINSNSISLNSTLDDTLKTTRPINKFSRSSSVQNTSSLKQGLTHQTSVPASYSPAVVVMNQSARSEDAPHSDTWPSRHSSSKTHSVSTMEERPRSRSQGQEKSSPNTSRTDSYRVAMRNDASDCSSPSTARAPSYRYAVNKESENSKSRRMSADSKSLSPRSQESESSPSTARAPSYRFAVNNESENSKTRRRSAGSVDSKNSSPRTPEMDINVNRADSYRMAVRQTNGIVSSADVAARNSSYRVAVRENGDVTDKQSLLPMPQEPSDKRDNRRRGITDIDQLKEFTNDNSQRKGGLKSASNLFATINSSKKRMNVQSDIESLLRPATSPSPETSRSSKSPKLPKSPKSPKADKNKNKEHRSSTYIRFDPIFEDKEDFLNSSAEALRAASISSLNRSIHDGSSANFAGAEEDPLLGQKLSHPLPVTRGSRSSLQGRKVDEKAVMSILDSIKSTIKSISNKKGDSEDESKYGTGV